ncbi:fibronectin type III domain-containing protein [uncultured Winogradskyella sp.]|uniref:fibronectin type III domain-containing protein n=1 Tax=uncultured Winogradskyella sp. TaxID=395353 RepID=UPI0030D7A86D
MKVKTIITQILLFIIAFSFANNDKYRLILVDDPATTITIGWNQISGTSPTVYYDTVDHDSNFAMYTFSKTVDRGVITKGMNNLFARLTGLTPNTNYYFVINDSEGTSDRFWFRTAPNDNSRLSIIAGGDSRNNRTPRQNANKLVAKLKPHGILFAGDMTDDSTPIEWIDWFDDWQLTTANDGRMFPIIPARGNHEDGSEIYDLFDTTENSYYAITFGDNLFRAYTLNSEISVLGDQLTWLKNDLSESSDVTWKAAQYHKPMRPHTESKVNNNNQYFAWAELFYDQEVRLVVDCDSHMAKTTWPVKPSSEPGNDEGFVIEKNNGTVYTGEGCWGAPLRPNNDIKSWTRNSGTFNQFKLIFVEPSKIELRTILVDNADTVGEVSNTDQFTLPSLLNVFSPPTGSVVTISNNNDVVCPTEFSPCDDGDPNTIYDEEDGSCNCSGFDSYNISEYTTNVVIGSDDAEELISSGAVSTSSTDLELIRDSFSQIVGVRFNNLDIPKQSTIIRAYIQFTVNESINPLNIEDPQDDTDLIFHGELSPNSNTFTTATNNISSRILTTNSEPWDNLQDWGTIGNAGFYQRTTNLESIVTEIMSQPTWDSGNPITFIISGTGQRIADSFEENGDPKLILLYNSNCPIRLIELGEQSSCNEINDTYSQEIIISYENAPTSGTLNINEQTFTITTSPQTVTLTGLNSDGIDVDIEAYFTADSECVTLKKRFFEAPSNCSNGGIPNNLTDDSINLALLTEATISGSVVNGRGNPTDILYDPVLMNYRTITDFNQYGVLFRESLGTPNAENGFNWQANWPNIKNINYITFGGSYNNQPQVNTQWRISYREDGIWTILEEGIGGWVHDEGIYEWGGSSTNPIKADALRVQLFSDGFTEVKSIHLRGRGGSSSQASDDSATTPKATLIQYLSPGNSCGITIPSNTMLYCDGSWISGDGPTDTTDTVNIIIGDGTFTIPEDSNIEINNIEVATGASLIIEQGAGLIVNGDFTNNGSVELQSSSNKYSSLIIEGTATGNMSYKRHVNNYNGPTGNDLVSSPFNGETFGTFTGANPNLFENPGNTDQKLFGPFSETTGSYQTLFATANSTVTLDKGVGYRAARDASEDIVSGTTLTFTGTAETNGFTMPITESATSFSGWNLIGNPYPSYMDFDTFFNLNKTELDAGTYQAIYGYDGDASNGWTILNNLSTGTLIAPGQGFFVKVKSGGGTITFTPEMRVKGNTDDFIGGRTNMGLVKVEIDNTTTTFETDIYFNTNASLGLDPGYDASLFGGSAPDYAVYTHLVEQNTGTPIAIQAVGEDAMNNVVIPLGIHATQGENITVRIAEMTIPATVNVYLEDTSNNTFTLLNTNTYNFVADTDIIQAGRFFLRFESSSLNIDEQNLNGLSIYTNQSEKAIVIKGQLQNNTEFTLFDIHGRVINKQTLDTSSTTQTIDVANLSIGIYIVQLKNELSEKRIQKLIIR